MKSATYELLAATSSDAPALARMRRRSLIELGLLAPAESASFERTAAAEFVQLFALDRLESRLLESDGNIVGCASALFWTRLPYPQTSLHAELAGVYVAPPYRRNGFARELCAAVLAAAELRGVRRIVVHPSAAGSSLYSKLGFIESGQLRLAGFLNRAPRAPNRSTPVREECPGDVTPRG
jgi:GNAT superfamily N-acetyltransferase